MNPIESVNSTAMLNAAAATAFALLVAQGIPRALRSIYNWTAAALFGSLPGRKRRIAMLFAGISALWAFVLAGLLWAPLNELAPRVVPFPDGGVRWVLTLIEIWLLFLVPIGMGLTEAYFTRGSYLYRASMIPRAFVHTVGIALAMLTLVPWIIWRFLFVRLRRKREEQLRIDIDVEHYDSVTDALLATMHRAGLTATVAPLPQMVIVARWFLFRLGPPLLRPDAEYEARRIIGDGYIMLVFDGLIDIIADRSLVSRVRQGLIGGVPPRGLWLTHSEEARELERLIRSPDADLSDIPRRIAEVDATLDEWRILSWEYLQILTERESKPRRKRPRRAMPPADSFGVLLRTSVYSSHSATSRKFAASAANANEPSLRSFPARNNAPIAARASSPPVLTRFTPSSASSRTFTSIPGNPASTLTGRATDEHTAAISSRVRIPGAYSTSAPASSYACSRLIVSPRSARPCR